MSYELEEISQKTVMEIPRGSGLLWTDKKSDDIARCLGFNPRHIYLNSRSGTAAADGQIKNELFPAGEYAEGGTSKYFTSENVSSTKYFHKNIFVYTDIIQNQSVGDYKAPLLRIVPVEKGWGEVCCVKYEKPYFFPLSRSRISDIEINIRNDTGSPLSFESGTAIVTLVFRRKTAKFFD